MIERLKYIQEKIRELRDSPGHFCPAVENEGDHCTCGEYDHLIDEIDEIIKELKDE